MPTPSHDASFPPSPTTSTKSDTRLVLTTPPSTSVSADSPSQPLSGYNTHSSTRIQQQQSAHRPSVGSSDNPHHISSRNNRRNSKINSSTTPLSVVPSNQPAISSTFNWLDLGGATMPASPGTGTGTVTYGDRKNAPQTYVHELETTGTTEPHTFDREEARTIGIGGRRRGSADHYHDDVGAGADEAGIAGGDAGSGASGCRTYKRRWFGLVQLCLLNIIVSWDVRMTNPHNPSTPSPCDPGYAAISSPNLQLGGSMWKRVLHRSCSVGYLLVESAPSAGDYQPGIVFARANHGDVCF